VRDETLRGVAGKVHYDIDPTIDYPRHFIGHVAVRLTDGACWRSGRITRAGARCPMTREELTAKSAPTRRRPFPSAGLARVALVDALAAQPRLAPLMDALTA